MYFYKLSVVDNIAPDGCLPDVVIVRALRVQILKTGMKIESNFKLFENHLKTLILLSLDHSWSNIRKDFLYFKHFRGFGNLERVSFIFLDRIVPNFVFWRADFVSQLRSIRNAWGWSCFLPCDCQCETLLVTFFSGWSCYTLWEAL